MKQIKGIIELIQGNLEIVIVTAITLVVVGGCLWYVRRKPTDEMGGEIPSEPTDWTLFLSVALALVVGWCANTAYTSQSQEEGKVQLVSDCSDVSTLYEVQGEEMKPRYYCGYGESGDTFGCSEFK